MAKIYELRRFRCQSCGENIPPGGLYYFSRIEIVSGFDGVVPENAADADELIEAALRDIADTPEQDLIDDVHQEICILLCGRCRLILRDRIISMKKY